MRTIGGTNHKKRAEKKYIHEIYVDHMTRRTDLKQLCDKLCESESQYLNPAVISKTQVSTALRDLLNQVFDLLTKLYEREFGAVATNTTKI